MKKILLVSLVLALFAGWVHAQEQARISEEEALEMLQECNDNKAALEARIAELQSDLDALSAERSLFTREYDALMSEIAELEAEIAMYPSDYSVIKGDCLWKISAQRYIYNNSCAWPRIYRANMDLIKDPDLIYPGWVLTIPHGLVTSYTVIPGDYLWKIAGFCWIYDNPREWPTIYKANDDQIKDPDLIYPNQILSIPRD
jgi:nucleoid-associated protein YgaU